MYVKQPFILIRMAPKGEMRIQSVFRQKCPFATRLTRRLVGAPKHIAAGKLVRLQLAVLDPRFTVLGCVAHLLVKVLAGDVVVSLGQDGSLDPYQAAGWKLS